MSPVCLPGLTSALVCLLFVTSGTTSVPFLESDHVTLVTCTHERTNLVLLKVFEAGEEGNIAAFNEIENSCLGNFTLYACSTDREVKVKAVVDEGRNQTIRCHAYVKQGRYVVHKYIGAVNITTPDRTSRTETTQGLQVQGLHTQGLHTQGLHTQGLQVQGLHTQGLQGPQAQGLQAQGISSTTVQSPLRDQLRDTCPPSHISI
ncbi:uncharacterized protein LOC112569258 [Pomacea canaliculata]|uniref:uncharacterized protein LOC112569258 n=1 Tax=Pomacea canaliculata TaxID=400727 RepID=UPI000D732328|nr:uncharacterized protein LOC112569258 [Pomacea canaliculata]XP_025102784.1 uncharacterized protein LOC112569258 [Pomacea canaliculata]